MNEIKERLNRRGRELRQLILEDYVRRVVTVHGGWASVSGMQA